MKSSANLATTLRNLPDLLTVEDIQGVLRIGRSKAYALLENGSIRSIRIGSTYRIPKSCVIDFIKRAS